MCRILDYDVVLELGGDVMNESDVLSMLATRFRQTNDFV